MTHPIIAAALTMSSTHKVVTTYADGRVRTFSTRNQSSAEMQATLERRKIGRDITDRMTGDTVRIISVIVEKI